MAFKLEYLGHTLEAGADLSSLQYSAVSLDDGARSINGAEAGGILQNKPKSNEFADIAYVGIMKFRAGGTILKDSWLRVDSNSTMIVAGSGYHLVGKSLMAVSSGSIGTGKFNFVNPPYASESSFVA